MDRKIIGIGIGAILTLSLFIIMGMAFAQKNEEVKSPDFIDADGDGICDNAGSCPYKEKSTGFVDADGDGICDNAGSCPMRQGKGRCGASGGCKGGCQRYMAK